MASRFVLSHFSLFWFHRYWSFIFHTGTVALNQDMTMFWRFLVSFFCVWCFENFSEHLSNILSSLIGPTHRKRLNLASVNLKNWSAKFWSLANNNNSFSWKQNWKSINDIFEGNIQQVFVTLRRGIEFCTSGFVQTNAG